MKSMVCSIKIQELLRDFVRETKAVFGKQLRGIYLHGSLAMGCFHEKKSDVDLLVVVNKPLSMDQKRMYLEKILRLNERAPEKGIEMSVVLDKAMNPFCHPAPFEMHYSNAHRKSYNEDPEATLKRMIGTDRDLAAHVRIVNLYGITLFGEDKESVFSKVSHEDYLDALMYDIENAREDILEHPMYVTFSLCRVLAYVKTGKALSKKEGGMWALENVDKSFEEIILDALNAYETDADMSVSSDTAHRFADEMLSDIQREIGQK